MADECISRCMCACSRRVHLKAKKILKPSPFTERIEPSNATAGTIDRQTARNVNTAFEFRVFI